MKSIAQDPQLKRYFRKRHLEKSSQNIYIEALRNYYELTGLTPSEAIDEADDDEDNIPRMKKRRITSHLDDFEEYLEKKYAENTLKMYISIVKSFYKFNLITLPDDIRRSPNPTADKESTDIPNRENIKKAMTYANPKYQAMIALMASSGMRQGDIRELTLGDLSKALSKYVKVDVNEFKYIGELVSEKIPNPLGPLTWRKFMQKKKRWYTTFSTPESLHYILLYLDFNPPQNFTENTILFRNPNDGPTSRITLNKYFKKITNQCGWEGKPKEYSFFRPHNLRKWFATELYKRIGRDDTRHLLGHRVRDTSGKYILPDYDDLYYKYYTEMDAITIFAKVEVHNITDEKIDKMEKKTEVLEKMVQELMEEKMNKKEGVS